MPWRSRLGEKLRLPFFEVFLGLESCMVGGARAFVAVFVGLLLGWWIYVPLHELLHAYGCLVVGGEVTRLEIDFLYGGTVLAKWIPWVVPGSEYAGRLSGFSTGGSDLVYLVTDLAPYLLTLWPGLWAMRLGIRNEWRLLYGAMLPWALAPFISLTGDAYEIGSILLTQIPPWSSERMQNVIRGDDLFLLPARLADADLGGTAWLGVVLAVFLGALWALAWWYLASSIAASLGQAKLEDPGELAR
jgi:hypothetical protein